MDRNALPVLSAGIGLFAAIFVLFAKEYLEKKKNTKTSAGIIYLLNLSLSESLSLHPDNASHLALDKIMVSISSFSSNVDLVKAFLYYSDAYGRYKAAWALGKMPGDNETDHIKQKLEASKSILENFI